jgi:hypothetical protein
MTGDFPPEFFEIVVIMMLLVVSKSTGSGKDSENIGTGNVVSFMKFTNNYSTNLKGSFLGFS